MLKITFLALSLAMLSGCATRYMDNEGSNNGGRFVVGSYDNQATVFHCPDAVNKGDCERIDVDFK